MKKAAFWLRVLVLAAVSALAGGYILLVLEVPSFRFADHSLRLRILPFGLLFLLFMALLTSLWLGFSKLAASLFGLDPARTRNRDLWSFTPVFFFLLLPLAVRHYMDFNDLSARVGIMGLSVLAAVIYLKAAELAVWNAERPLRRPLLVRRLAALTLKRKVVLLFAAALVVSNALSAVLISGGTTFAGDEPHYLTITHSAVHDADIDVSNDYRNGVYTRYIGQDVRIKPHTAPRTKGRYSFHSPGTSFLLIPFYALADLLGAGTFPYIIRFGVSLFGALLGIQLFLFALRYWEDERLALKLWALYGFTSPILFYSIHVYPEIIVAFLSLWAFRMIRFRTSFSRPSLIGLGALLALPIWFNTVKYLPLTGALLLYGLWTLWRKHRVGWNILIFLVVLAGLTAGYFAFQQSVYGSASLSAITTKGQLDSGESVSFYKAMLFDIPFRYRWETLAGYFLDQKDGLLFYSPFYFFAFLGLIDMARKKFKDLLLLLFICVPYILLSAFLTQRTGYAPPARPLVSSSWWLILLVGAFLASNRKKVFGLLFGACTFVSFLFSALLVRHPLALYQVTTLGETDRAGGLFRELSNLHIFIPRVLPSFIKSADSAWIANWAWMGGIVIFMAAYVLTRAHGFRVRFPFHAAVAALALAVVFVLAVLYPRPVLRDAQNAAYDSGEKITFYSLSRAAPMAGPGDFRLSESERAYVFRFTSWRELSGFRLHLRAEEGEFEVLIRYFDEEVARRLVTAQASAVDFVPPGAYRLKKIFFYEFTFDIEKIRGPSLRQNPFHLALVPVE